MVIANSKQGSGVHSARHLGRPSRNWFPAPYSLGLVGWLLGGLCVVRSHAFLSPAGAQLPAASARSQETATATPRVTSPPSEPPEAYRNEATLCDVCFVDSKQGWAVGELGVIWHTTSGGAQWHRQRSPVDTRLNSVFFLDANQGWAAGGRFVPFSTRHDGVVLQTTDGGVTWTEIRGVLLPAVQRIYFEDSRRGWAMGLDNRQFPTQIFHTTDGGRTWAGVTGDPSASVIAGDFPRAASPGSVPLFLDRWGTVFTLQRGQARRAAQLPAAEWALSGDLKIVAPQVAIAVTGQPPQLTTDGGAAWYELPTFPHAAGQEFQLTAAAANGSRVWLAGSPGTCVWRSLDHAQTWQPIMTGESFPIHRLHFVDDEHGWAVGEWGTILSTDDGGTTWRRQRGGSIRMAAMVVSARGGIVPCDVVAQLSAADDYRVHVLTLFQDLPAAGLLSDSFASINDTGVPPSEARLAAAMSRLGASSSQLTRWQSTAAIAQPTLSPMIADWDAQLGASSVGWLTERLVREIRIRTPSLIVTGDAHHDPQTELLQRIVAEAARLAADQYAYPEQLTSGGLAVWQTERVVREVTGGQDGNDVRRGTSWQHHAATRSAQQISLATGRTLADITFAARGLLAQTLLMTPEIMTPTARTFAPLDRESLLTSASPAVTAKRTSDRATSARLPQAATDRDLLQGISLQFGSAARRPRGRGSEISELRQEALQRRTAEAMFLVGDRLTAGGDQLLEQFEQWTEALPSSDAGDLLFQLATRLAVNGQWRLAEQAYLKFLKTQPQHPLREAAWSWLIRYRTSSEVAWRKARAAQLPLAGSAVRLASAETAVDEVSGSPPASTGRVTATHHTTEPPFPQVAVAWGQSLSRQDPQLYSEPQIRLAIAAAFRQVDRGQEALALYKQQLAAPASSWWQELAATELAICSMERSNTESAVLERAWRCVHTSTPPHLDAALDDEVWRQARPVKLSIDNAMPPAGAEDRSATELAAIYWAYDEEYLYLAAECPLIAGVNYVAGRRPRPRDADLQAYDRLQFALDTNRDYQSAWQLDVDQRGWTTDSLLGDASWNPSWYVASAKDDQAWRVEIAIPWNELAATPPASGEAWAIQVRRIIPRLGTQSSRSRAAEQPRTAPLVWLSFE